MIFDRTAALIGNENLNKLKKSCVAVVGIGGVGSAAAEALCRSGIGRLILLDSDNVDETNINRQLIATTSVIGKSKCETARLRYLDINPECEIITLQMLYNEETSDRLFSLNPDYIIDAIDTVTFKIHLIKTAVDFNIPIFSSMGTGNRLYPSEFKLGDISETKGCGCGLARVMRRELKKRGITSLPVVYSTEQPKNIIIDENNRHIPASISFCPPVAGYILAGAVVNQIIEK